jgi:hypothetical protein
MAPKISKTSKQAATGTTRHITFTIPETLEIVMNPGVNTNQKCHYGIIQDCTYDQKKHKEKNYLQEPGSV